MNLRRQLNGRIFSHCGPANPQRWTVPGNSLLTLGVAILRAEIEEIIHLTQHQKAMGKADGTHS